MPCDFTKTRSRTSTTTTTLTWRRRVIASTTAQPIVQVDLLDWGQLLGAIIVSIGGRLGFGLRREIAEVVMIDEAIGRVFRPAKAFLHVLLVNVLPRAVDTLLRERAPTCKWCHRQQNLRAHD